MTGFSGWLDAKLEEYLILHAATVRGDTLKEVHDVLEAGMPRPMRMMQDDRSIGIAWSLDRIIELSCPGEGGNPPDLEVRRPPSREPSLGPFPEEDPGTYPLPLPED